MDETPEALRLADALDTCGLIVGDDLRDAAADELRRLHEAHDWQHKMAGERLRRIEKLEAINRELLDALKYHQEQTRPIQRTTDIINKLSGE